MATPVEVPPRARGAPAPTRTRNDAQPERTRGKGTARQAVPQVKGLRALLLKRQANFAWMTCGGLNQVGNTTEVGAASLLITESAKYLISNNIESPRKIHEDGLKQLGFSIETFPWHEDREASIVRELAGGGLPGSNIPFPNAQVMAEEIARLRYSLTPEEVERYRWLGLKAAVAVENTLLEARPGEKESEVVGRLCHELWRWPGSPAPDRRSWRKATNSRDQSGVSLERVRPRR